MPNAGAANSALDKGREPRLPTRIITYAWGERYVDELLSLTLPAALAPGNLPYVASVCPCLFIILTQEIFFERVLKSPAVSRIRKLCPVRLIGLDDLIVAPDKYGMTLTYALHRGFIDLGPSMTDHWLIFFNADFILADGSWRTLLTHLARGKRLVASPSYCVRSGEVVSELRKRIDPRAGTLVLEPRELASLVLRHRHDTVRAKTVNQRIYSARYMDQFYWLVDDTTLLGHQMPVSIVGMRPEYYVRQPNSYWDHGFMRELCPEAEICVIGDSDEFLMMELREKEIAADQISAEWPSLSEIGKRMLIWVTPYQRDFARYPLTLHTEDLPPQVDDARRQLKAFVDEVLRHSPADLPSHIDHPQWNYHWRPFIEARHKYLSARLGSATADARPLEVLSDLDKAWWRLDGLEKSYLRRRAEITKLMDHERDIVRRARDRLDETTESSSEKLIAKFLAPQPDRDAGDSDMIPCLDLTRDREKRSAVVPTGVRSHSVPWVAAIAEYEQEQETAQRRLLTRITEFIDREEEKQLRSLEIEFEAAQRHLRNDYDRLMPRAVHSAVPMEAGELGSLGASEPGPPKAGERGSPEAAEPGSPEAAEPGSPEAGEAVPHVLIQHGPITHAAYTGSIALRLTTLIYHCLFGRLPRVRVLHPYWAPLRYLVRLVDRSAEQGARNVLMVGSSVADGIADHLPGAHARLSLAQVIGKDLDQAFEQRPEFDLCICSLTIPEASSIAQIVRAVTPYMGVGGRLIVFLSNLELNHDLRNDKNLLRAVTELPTSISLYFAGGSRSARVLRRVHRVRSSIHVKRYLNSPPVELDHRSRFLSRIIKHIQPVSVIAEAISRIFFFLFIAPQAFAANMEEAKISKAEASSCPTNCTSITIEISIGPPQSEAGH